MNPCIFVKRRLLNPYIIPCAFLLVIPVFTQAQVDIDVVETECDFHISAQVTHPRCPGDNNGRIVVTATSDDGTTLQYNWLNLSTANNTNAANNLTHGNYNVVVFSETCEDTLHFELLDPEEIDAPPLDTTVCGASTIDLMQNVSGGTGNYTINIVTVFGPSQSCVNCDNTTVEISTFTILNVEIFDENGCGTVRPVVVNVRPPLEANATIVQEESCNENGIVEINATGGTQNYLYRILDATTPNSNDGSYQTSNVFENLAGDSNYVFQVYDPAATCRTNVDVFLAAIAYADTASISTTDVSCFGADDGFIEVSVSNPTDVMGYSLNDPNSESDVVQVDPTFENLAPGDYIVYVFDNDQGCQELPVSITEPALLNLSAATEDASCEGSADGSVELTIEGGNNSFQYALSNDPSGGNVDQGDFFDANVVDTLLPGTYLAFVMDDRNCEDEVLFTISAPEAPDVNTITIPSYPLAN